MLEGLKYQDFQKGTFHNTLNTAYDATMGALAIVDRLLRGNFELGIKITLGFFPMRS